MSDKPVKLDELSQAALASIHYVHCRAMATGDTLDCDCNKRLHEEIVKYVTRHRAKHGVQDLEKAQHYLEKLIEHERSVAPTAGRRKRRG